MPANPWLIVFGVILLFSAKSVLFDDALLACWFFEDLLFSANSVISPPASPLVEHAKKFSFLYGLSCGPGLWLTSLGLAKQFAFAIAPACAAALTVRAYFKSLLLLGARLEQASALSLLLILTTPLLVYSRIAYSEIYQACFLIHIAYYWLRIQSVSDKKNLIGLSVASGLLLCTKIIFVYLVALITLGLYFRSSSKLRACFTYMLGLLPFLVLIGLYNFHRYDSFVDFGYSLGSDQRGFDVPWYIGSVGLLVSFGKGIVFYAPQILLLDLVFFRLTRNRSYYFDLCLLVFPALIIFGSWWAWSGDWAWGPRFMVPFLPVCLLILANIDFSERLFKWSFITTTLWGFVVNLSGALLDYRYVIRSLNEDLLTKHSAGSDYLSYQLQHFELAYSPILSQIALVFNKLLGFELNFTWPLPGTAEVPWNLFVFDFGFSFAILVLLLMVLLLVYAFTFVFTAHE